MKFVIMAGGQGTKLWPISRDNYPKQFNNILGDKTLFQLNLEALLKKYSPEDIFVSVSENYVDYVKKQGPQIPYTNYIIEPHIKKATGPATCYSMVHMSLKYPNEVIMYYVQPVTIRTPVEKYLDMISLIENLVKDTGCLVTGGKYPLYPEVGSDYQKLTNLIKDPSGMEIYDAVEFVQRPKTLEEATTMINSMQLALHCNHSAWTPTDFFNFLRQYKKDWYDVSVELKDLIQNNASEDDILRVYSKFTTGNIELFTKSLYEAGKVKVVILPFEWRHITTWNDIYEYEVSKKDTLSSGLHVLLDSHNNLIINKTNKLISGIGLKDMVIVQTEDSIFISPRNDSGRVGELLKLLEENGLSQYL